jgi:hypothetical protein
VYYLYINKYPPYPKESNTISRLQLSLCISSHVPIFCTTRNPASHIRNRSTITISRKRYRTQLAVRTDIVDRSIYRQNYSGTGQRSLTDPPHPLYPSFIRSPYSIPTLRQKWLDYSFYSIRRGAPAGWPGSPLLATLIPTARENSSDCFTILAANGAWALIMSYSILRLNCIEY